VGYTHHASGLSHNIEELFQIFCGQLRYFPVLSGILSSQEQFFFDFIDGHRHPLAVTHAG
jgi:hypothetical protein